MERRVHADPLHHGDIVGTLAVDDGAVATSGTSERGHHLWDGRDGYGPRPGIAHRHRRPPGLGRALATAGFAMGGDGIEWVSRFDGYHALAVTSRACWWPTPSSPPRRRLTTHRAVAHLVRHDLTT